MSFVIQKETQLLKVGLSVVPERMYIESVVRERKVELKMNHFLFLECVV